MTADTPLGPKHPFQKGDHGPNCKECGWHRGHWLHDEKPYAELTVHATGNPNGRLTVELRKTDQWDADPKNMVTCIVVEDEK